VELNAIESGVTGISCGLRVVFDGFLNFFNREGLRHGQRLHAVRIGPHGAISGDR
jgi:hypothetical protein